MNNTKCSNCLFFEVCTSRVCCDNYTPINEDCDDNIDTYIEERRFEYREAWFSYIDDEG